MASARSPPAGGPLSPLPVLRELPAPKEDPEATFHPMTNQRSMSLAARRNSVGVPASERLFADAARIESRRQQRERRQAEIQLRDCTFYPALTAAPPPAVSAAAPRPAPLLPPPPPLPVSSSAAAAMYERQQHWLRERESRLELERVQRDAKELDGCSFRPAVSRAVPLPNDTATPASVTSYASAAVAAAAAASSVAIVVPPPQPLPLTALVGVEAHLARAQRARLLAAERARLRHKDGSGWTGRLTQPRDLVSSVAQRRGRALSVDAGDRSAAPRSRGTRAASVDMGTRAVSRLPRAETGARASSLPRPPPRSRIGSVGSASSAVNSRGRSGGGWAPPLSSAAAAPAVRAVEAVEASLWREAARGDAVGEGGRGPAGGSSSDSRIGYDDFGVPAPEQPWPRRASLYMPPPPRVDMAARGRSRRSSLPGPRDRVPARPALPVARRIHEGTAASDSASERAPPPPLPPPPPPFAPHLLAAARPPLSDGWGKAPNRLTGSAYAWDEVSQRLSNAVHRALTLAPRHGGTEAGVRAKELYDVAGVDDGGVSSATTRTRARHDLENVPY